MKFQIGRKYLFVNIESALRTSEGDKNILRTPAVSCVDDKGIIDPVHFKHTGKVEYRIVTNVSFIELRCSDCLIIEEYPGYQYFFRNEKGEIYSADPFDENQSPKPEDFGDFIVSRNKDFSDENSQKFALVSNLIRNAYMDSLFNHKEKYCRNVSFQFKHKYDDKVLFTVNSNESETRYFQFLMSIIPSGWELTINLHKGSKFELVQI